MSTNFTGVTFAKQKVTPSDDAIIRRAILPDGILYGCELSYSGSTLTMAAGQLMICGRQIRHPASQNWAVIDATSGFARLLLTIDLTKTATKESFEQVVDSIEYATAEDGFPDLEQTDINVSGSRYQVVACVVSLGAGGITGIVSQLGKSVVEGSGGLNFSVVGGLTQPADLSENTIWVPTDVGITCWIFSATESTEPENGMVWFLTGTSSTVAFNALKKNGIEVCPLSARQYVDGEWVDVEAKIYQDGAWSDFLYYLYKAGWSEVETKAKWTTSTRWIPSNAKQPTLSVSSTGMTATVSDTTGNYMGGLLETTDGVDLTNYKTLVCVVSAYTKTGTDGWTTLGITKNLTGGTIDLIAATTVSEAKTYAFDISSISGICDIVVQFNTSSGTSQTSSITFSEIYLE